MRAKVAVPVNAAFDQGCWRRRPRSSTAAASSFAPIARAPSSPRTAISLKWKSATSVSSRSAGPGRSSSIAPPKPKCAAPDSSATTRKGIKNTIAPARNVGERARRSHQSTPLSIRAVGAVDPVAPQRPHRRSLRSPELHRRPEPEYHCKGIRRRRRHHHRAASSRCTTQAAGAGQSAGRNAPSRKCRRESTPATSLCQCCGIWRSLSMTR